ncbi:hypothetical protein HY969_00645 [Candidatus Kaiserbacteria bacterium]|nr:hypothetical protein [Candidatus Kaiserbacteria bacterium]
MALRPVLFLAVFIVALVTASPTAAQNSFSLTASPLLLHFNPANPEPGDLLDVSVTSLTFDVSEELVLWYVDNELVQSGVGVSRIPVQLPASGDSTHIAAVIAKDQQAIARIDTNVRPATVDLLWESDSLTPPFYKGKHLASPSSRITVEARARLTDTEGNGVAPTSATYTWYRNGALLKGVSGRGKSSATFPAPLLFGSDTIRVIVTAPNGGNQAEKSIVIPAVDPTLALYKDDPLFGVTYHSTIENPSTFPEGEITVIGFPLFAPRVFSLNNPALEYTWLVNSRTVQIDPENPWRLTINAENSSGLARVELSVSHLFDITMHAVGTWNLLLNAGLGSEGNNSLFAPDTSL